MPTTRLHQILQMLKDEPNDSFLNYALAIEYAISGDIKKAIELIEALLKRDPTYLGAYYQLGKYYEETGQLQMAVNTYNNGMIIAQQQKNRKAEGELKEAVMMLED